MADKRMSIEQMMLKYPNQWLFITDCEISENTELISGVVSVNSPCRDVVYKALTNHEGESAIRYTGRLPEGIAYLL